MKVAIYYNNNDVRIEERPKPEIGDGEFLLKMMASGICGSDVMEWYRLKTAPRVLGHEVTGEIVETGEGVPYKVGDRVFVSHHVPCNECEQCRAGHHTACETLHRTNFDPGGFAEFIRIPEINVRNGVYRLPENVSYEDGTFIEPLACVVRGQRLAGIGKGQTVLVLGSGISGLLHIQLAKLKGAKRIIAMDVNQSRLDMARRFGADEVMGAEEEIDVKADVVIVCTGAEAAAMQALKCVGRGGTVLFFAVPEPGFELTVPINEFWRNEVTVRTSYGAAPDDLKEALELIEEGRINVHDMVTHVLPLDKAAEGFNLVAQANESLKVILKPNK
ncbi:MAG: zinc-dependent dehydrogenase [Candidatus Altiarchaeota archaeon]|nr:zinc-dependent dehydrogenase [Candidatus Altiarchaeota archaeon]